MAGLPICEMCSLASPVGGNPITYSGTGSEVTQRIAVPIIGAIVPSTFVRLAVIPAVYVLIKGW